MALESEGTYQAEKAISPTEDLMREHGILLRVLLIYRDIISRLTGEKPFCPIVYPAAINAANIAKTFIEEYHQLLEEQYVFPRFLQNEQYTALIRTLLEQHNAARCLTTNILRLLSSDYFNCYQLIYLLTQYIRMYDPHSAREDTMVFPAFHYLVSEKTFQELGEKFEEIEELKFGENGFQSIVQQVAQIEQSLGIYELGQFTPNCIL